MKQFCDYHPTRTAHWSCPKCSSKLCPECVLKREKGELFKGEMLHFCPKCNVLVEWCGVENIIDPFWKRIPKIFAYPFSSLHPAGLILVLSILIFLLGGPGLFNVLMRAALFLIVLKYSFEALKATAGGDLRPPKIGLKTISDDMNQVVKQYVLYFLIFMAFGGLSAAVNPLVGTLFIVAALFLTPAMIILLVTTGSLLHALNPLVFIRLAYRIGWGYLLMYFFLMLLGSAPSIAAQFIVKYLPSGLHIFLVSLAQNYYTIISYHLMGYVILQYHEEIGYKIEHDDFRDQSSEETGSEAADLESMILKEINPLVQDGKYDEAIAVIQEMTHGAEITSHELSSRYYALLKMTHRTSQLLECAVSHLELSIKDKNKKAALDIYSECTAIDPEFLPTAMSLFKVGEWLNETGNAKMSVMAYNRLVKAYPENSLVPKSYFRVAQIFNDRMMRPEKAKKILNGLIKKYPEHEMVPQIKSYLASMM